MKAGGSPGRLMIPYLLGELSEEDQTNLERACLDDDELFEELLAVEAELTDDYVRGDLVGRERAAFEKRLLKSPNATRQIELAKLITQKRSSRSPFHAIGSETLAGSSARGLPTERRIKWWPSGWLSAPARLVPVGAVAILVIGIGISLGLLLWKRQPSQSSGNLAPTAQSQPSGQKADTSPPVAKQPDQLNALVIATFVITGGGERDAGSVNEIKVPAGTDRVQLQVDLTATRYTSYRASLQKIGGPPMIRFSDLRTSPSKAGTTLSIELPASDLPAGDSILTLTGARGNQASPDIIGKYFVRRVR